MSEGRPSELRYQVTARIGSKGYPRVNVAAGTQVWLSWTDESGGWWQWSRNPAWAHPFESTETALAAVKGCPGPWFLVPDRRTIKMIRGTYYPALPDRFDTALPSPTPRPR